MESPDAGAELSPQRGQSTSETRRRKSMKHTVARSAAMEEEMMLAQSSIHEAMEAHKSTQNVLLKMHTLREWHKIYQSASHMATVRRKLFILQMNSLLRTTLKEWQRVYKAKSWVRLHLGRRARAKARVLLVAAFRAWRDVCRQEREGKERQAKAGDGRNERTAAQVLCEWRWLAFEDPESEGARARKLRLAYRLIGEDLESDGARARKLRLVHRLIAE
ncbi:hypothetical protein T484DRAFT_1908809, partial [Baffinella frigidus]